MKVLLKNLFQTFLLLLFAVFGTASAWSVPADWHKVNHHSFAQNIELQSANVRVTARVPPLANCNVAVTGAYIHGGGKLHAFSSEDLQWASLNFDESLVAPFAGEAILGFSEATAGTTFFTVAGTGTAIAGHLVLRNGDEIIKIVDDFGRVFTPVSQNADDAGRLIVTNSDGIPGYIDNVVGFTPSAPTGRALTTQWDNWTPPSGYVRNADGTVTHPATGQVYTPARDASGNVRTTSSGEPIFNTTSGGSTAQTTLTTPSTSGTTINVATNNGVLPSGSGNYAPDHLPGFGSQVDPRLPDRVSGPTQGVVDTPDGPVYLQSGVNGPASGYNNPDLPAVNQASSHVEGHAAALMSQNGITDMTVTINNVGGPCGNCLSQVPDMLPTGSTLNVRWMDADGALQVTTIPGRAN